MTTHLITRNSIALRSILLSRRIGCWRAGRLFGNIYRTCDIDVCLEHLVVSSYNHLVISYRTKEEPLSKRFNLDIQIRNQPRELGINRNKKTNEMKAEEWVYHYHRRVVEERHKSGRFDVVWE